MNSNTQGELTTTAVNTTSIGSIKCAAHHTIMAARTKTNHTRSTQNTSQRTTAVNHRERGSHNQTLSTNSIGHESCSLHSNSRMQKSERFHPHHNTINHNNTTGMIAGHANVMRRYNPTALSNDLAQGERITNRSHTPSHREREQQAWQLEMSGQHQKHEGNLASDLNSPDLMKKSAVTYKAVLAKRGLLVKDTLGAGSYSKVKHACYVKRVDAKNPQLYPNEVAVKIIDRTVAPKDFQHKFLPRELEIWPRIRHDNIVHMLQWFAEGHRVYMILEYVEGGDALKYIQTSGAVSEETGKTWTKQVTEAVKYLHELNVTHRDLKLENMLIDKHNNIKLCDFGFVKQCTDSDLSKTFCGSKSYAAPEILKGERYPPKKADIWAIGVILFILVTGRMPFDETKGNASLLDEHRKLDLQWPKGRRAVTAHCKDVTVFCLKFLWSERPNVIQLLNHPWFQTTATTK